MGVGGDHSALRYLELLPSGHVLVMVDFTNMFSIAYIDKRCCSLS